MIVSGFTLKNVQEEHYYCSALDHEHCVACVSRACKASQSAGQVTSCDVVECPRGCGQRYHGCKESEHVLLCAEERVACLNSQHGCPTLLQRKKLAEHLSGCPASIVHCRAEWNRLHSEPSRGREEQPVVRRKTYADCAQLDTALAMRDHRLLVDWLRCPQETSLSSPSCQTPQLLPSAQPQPLSPPHFDVATDLPDRWDSTFLQLKKKAVRPEERSAWCGVSSQPPASSPSVPGSVCDGAGSSSTERGVSTGNRWSPGKEVDGFSADPQDREAEDGQDREAEDGQVLRSILSVSMSVECIARCQPKPRNTYTFVCAQDVRRDEFAGHFHAVHDRIQSDLSGWMEQRCPLAYLGCPFSFRRFRPNLPNMTIHHSWLLESFGVTALSHQADFSHQTPSHLLPTGAQTADDQDTSTKCNHHPHISGGLPPGNCTEQHHTQLGPQPSTASVENSTLKGTEGSQQVSAAVSDAEPSRKAEDFKLASVLNPCAQDPPPSADSFSCLLDSISLKEDGCQAGSALGPHDPGNPQSPGLASAGTTCTPSAPDQNVQENGKISPSVEPADHRVCSTGHSPPGAGNYQSSVQPPQSSQYQLAHRKGVMYTGLSPDSRVRLSGMTLKPDSSREVTTTSTSALQLEDLPAEVLRHLTQFLDSFSLYNLSLVSRTMRDLCCTLLQDRGMVSLVWARQRLGDKAVWRIVGKRWSFSRCFEAVRSWRMTDYSPIASHLTSCPYNQDRVRHQDKFSIVPFCETPLNVQIRDMLQELLQRRRCAGRPRWYIAAMNKYFQRLCEDPHHTPP
ncbi:F-box only protein 30-like isoform X2 [Babylonia areolata]|uniref:F-box only protein 30-like isoform X2 n=1 Tax=Babylonia areolata TaxID=304850 RepID=UPI003FCF3337